MYFVYLLRCSDGTLYTGCTNNLDRRLAAHNAGKGAKYTRSRRPVALVYWSRPRTGPQPSGERAPSSGSPGGRSWS